MQVLVRTDNHIAAHEQHLIRLVEQEVRRRLGRFADRLSRVEVHLADESSRPAVRGDKRCTIEVRPLHGQPLSVTRTAASIGLVLSDAVQTLGELLESHFARHDDVKGGPTIRH